MPEQSPLSMFIANPDNIGVAAKVSPLGALYTAALPAPLTTKSAAIATVRNTTGEIVAANANRKGLVLSNASSKDVWIAFGESAVVGKGIVVFKNGGIFTMTPLSYSGLAIHAISSDTVTVGVQEFE